MRKIRVVLSATVLVALALTGLHVQRTAAIETSGIGALPAHPHLDNPRTKSIFVYDVEAADTLSDGVKVVNNTDTTKTLAVYAVDSQASSDGAFACAQMVDTKTEVGSWIKLAQNQVTLAANTNQIVPFTLTVPVNVKAGEHNGCIVVQDIAPATQNAGNGIVLSFRSALRVAVTTPGALQAELSFVDVKSKDINKKTLSVSPILKNKGNVSADANITVKLTGVLGFHYPFASIGGQFPAFPDTVSRFNFEVKKPFWGGWYIRDVQATYKKPLPSGQLSDNVTTIKAKNAVLYVAPQPAALAIEIGVAVIIVGLISYILHRLWIRHRLRKLATKVYTIKKGDTIESVASRHGLTWKQLAKINDIESPYTLHSGKTINVPAVHFKSGAVMHNNASTDKPQGTQPPVEQ